MSVQINCDMGESFGLWRMDDDAAILPFIDVANVACGFHASDPVVMRRMARFMPCRRATRRCAICLRSSPTLPRPSPPYTPPRGAEREFTRFPSRVPLRPNAKGFTHIAPSGPCPDVR